MKFKLKYEIFPLLAILATIVFAFYFYANAPRQVPTHWNIHGQVDDYSSKAFAAIFFPALILGMYFLFWLLPKIDPKRERYAKFARVYGLFRTAIVLFFVLMFFASSLAALGYNINISRIVPAGVGLLLILLGNYMGKIKSNWFVGIRTPWTLSSETVWQKTHRLGGWLFVFAGLYMLAGVFWSILWGQGTIFVIIIIIALMPIVYSYLLYKKEKK